MKSCCNQVRENKEARYKKKETKEFNSLIDEMKYYSDMEYICAGLNSFEREVVVIDCDSEDFGRSTFEELKKYNLIPHAIKTKPNGHSQFFFFVEKYYIGRGWFDKYNNLTCYHETHYEGNHYVWRRLTKLMNVLFQGDIGYTGYNCQNPFFKDGDITYIKPIKEKYNVKELFDFLSQLIRDENISENITKTIEEYYKKREINKQKKAENKIKTIIHFLDDEERLLNEFQRKEEIKQKLDELKQKKNKITGDNIIDILMEIENNSINKRIFVVTSQVCKSFWKHNSLHDPKKFEEIVNTVLKNWNYQDNAFDYTFEQLISRIRFDVSEIQYKDLSNAMIWEKVGYTKLQREESLKTRRIHMTNRRKQVYRILNKNIRFYKNLSFNAISKDIYNQYNKLYEDTISLSTIKNYLMIKFKNNLLLLKRYINQVKDNTFTYNNKLLTLDKNMKEYTKKDVVDCLFIPDKVKLRYRYG